MTGEAAPWDMNAVYRFQQHRRQGPLADRVRLALRRMQRRRQRLRDDALPADPAGKRAALRRDPGLQLELGRQPAQTSTSPTYTLGAVISGRYDAYIREFATKAKEWGQPFFLRFDWEMNGFWFPWSEGVNGNTPGQFVAAWRHVHDIFESVGAHNVTWVWCPNVDLYSSLTPLGELYPGDAYVDWTGLDGFNWGERARLPGLADLQPGLPPHLPPDRHQGRADKPMMLAEVASTDKGGNKPNWIKDMLNKVRHNYRKVRAVIWYDVDDRGTNWPLERSKKSSNAFRKGINPKAFRPNLYGGLTQSPIQPPPR